MRANVAVTLGQYPKACRGKPVGRRLPPGPGSMRAGDSLRDGLLLDGRFEEAAGPLAPLIDPATGQVHLAWADASLSQVDAAVASVRRHFPLWRDSTQEDRSGSLRSVASALAERREELAVALTHETGRPLTRNRLYVDMAAALFRQYAELARLDGGRLAPSNDRGQLSLVARAPHGVVAVLVPWNYPLLLLATKVAPALAAGNVVVIKPAPEAPLSLQVLAEVFVDCLPAGVVATVRGGPEVGERLVAAAEVDLVAFTGSTGVGRRIAQLCAQTTTATHLELGGKDPAVIFADADPEVAAQAVTWAAFLNAGQVCTSTERVYVHRTLHDHFVDTAVRLAAKLRVGDPFDEATQIGPMRSAARREAVRAHLREATAQGAEVVEGGEPLDRAGFFLAPAVVTGVHHGMALMQEETFGPVMPVMAFDDEDEAFALATDTPYGLGASIYTEKPRLVERAYRELQVGTVWVNDPVVDNLAAPFGGMRASGFARELGPEALDSFTIPRHVHWNLELVRKPWWFREE